ncbi:MAG TPA: hypothetical protein VGM78_00460 [Ilumatobacteraceae bacterium]
MILLVYRTVLRGPEMREEFDEMNRLTDAVALNTPGYIGAETFAVSPLETVGLLRFETQEAMAMWSDHPDHKTAHVRGVDELFSKYEVEVYDLVRQAGFDRAAQS